MSVDLVKAQMSATVVRKSEEPEHVAHHEWERVGSLVLAWSESVHGLDNKRKSLIVLENKSQNVSKWVTTLGRFHYDGGILDHSSDWDWSESSVEVITIVKNQGQCDSCWAFSMTDALERFFAV